MKILFFLFSMMFLANSAFADRVLIRLSDGFPVEYQSGNAPLGTLKKNHPEYKPDEVQEKYIESSDYEALHYEKIIKPYKEEKEKNIKSKEDRIKQKLGLNDSELQDLRDILSGK